MSAPLLELAGWLTAFTVTQTIEVPLYLWATRSLRVSFGASALTHPAVWFLFPLLPLPYWVMVTVAEGFAVGVEAAWLGWHRVPRALATSLAANAASFTAGLVVRATVGWP